MDSTMSTSTSLAAAAANCRCSRVVFVGNIPFHASEKELRDACELIGPVRSLRVAADPATGRRRGYAFVEYPDDETARSACRNLSGHDLRGRELRVGLAGRRRRRPRGDGEPVGLEDAIHAASLVSGTPPARPRHPVPGGAVRAGAAGDGGRAGGRRPRRPDAARGARPGAGRCRRAGGPSARHGGRG
ncbi:hypothetical protein PAHAL_5G444000 [Panicum hallii]|uniref:RRM domain-containing protein n=1 Tax=Panicum hallii TaxID=206008 RepID=A0A2T8IN97_9POAL|nr:hypothetical protein PAHAL_5G444000 [Panicum hallii]